MALKQFLVDALDLNYLLEIRDPTTKRLKGTIPEIMKNLFHAYADITAQSVIEKSTKLMEYKYNLTKPIDIIFTMAQDYQEYAEAFGTPQPVSHIITLVYNVFRKTHKFDTALENWNDTLPVDKTWEKFKIHFRKAGKNIQEFTRILTSNGTTKRICK